MGKIIDTSFEDRFAKKAKRLRDRELSDIRFILKSVEGRRVFWRLISSGYIFRDSANFDNVNNTFYNLGRQSLSREFFNDIFEASPNSYTVMQQEYESEQESERAIEEKMLDKNKESGLI